MSQPESTKAAIAGVFERAAATYDQVGVDFFRIVGQELVRHAQPRPGERVLDLGCGRGASAIPAARHVGPSGVVLGLDLAKGMTDAVNEQARAEGLTQLRAQVGDAEAPQVDGGWDVIQAGLVLFFLPDLAAALRTYRRLLAPSGRLAFSWFGPYDASWVAIQNALDADLAHDDRGPRRTGREGPFADVHSMAVALAHAGFHEEETIEQTIEVRYRDTDHFWQWMWSAGGRAVLEKLQEQGLFEAARERVNALLAERIESAGVLAQHMHVRYTVAR